MMPKSNLPNKIYFDALALVPEKKSGVGLTAHYTLINLIDLLDDTDIRLVVPFGKAKYLKQYIGPRVTVKTIPLPARLMELLLRMRLMPPIDWFLGGGIYIFPNYRNWPLWGSRALTYVYDLSFIRMPEVVKPKNRHYLRRYIRLWTNRTDTIITISEQIRNELEKYMGIYTGKIEIVPCGVDTSIFYRRPEQEIITVKKKYGINFERYILFVGNIEPRKNLVTLLDAYAKLPPALRNAYGLVIVGGDGWLNKSIYKRMEELQAEGMHVLKVDTYVKDADLPAIYSGASLLAHPALYEGFGMTPLEAMACEVPVVVSDIGSIREVVGEQGLYVDPHDTMQLKEALVRILTNRESTDVEAGKIRADEYSWSHAAKLLIKAIQHTKDQGRRRHIVLSYARGVYKTMDYAIRRIFGERQLEAYRPQPSDNETLQSRLLNDFLDEQPRRWQQMGLFSYIHGKALIIKPAKQLVKMVRNR